MLVHIVDAQIEARLLIEKGEYVLAVARGLLSPRAFVALNVALAPLMPEGQKYLQRP